MALDDGAGGFGLFAGLAAGTAGIAGAVAGQAKALTVEVESMQKFTSRVDELLTKLEGSQAAPKRMADGSLPSGHLGTGFGEADGLYAAYHTVHAQLAMLSKGLAGQIEALSIAVESSRVGYENVDDDVKQRMRRLHADAEKHYDPTRDPAVDHPTMPRGGAGGGGGTGNGGTGVGGGTGNGGSGDGGSGGNGSTAGGSF
ncbi:hypothetical protein [Streptomyces sp. NRRL S-87]|uniref:hypothetical protein n=1 Tax=Streptomyces sp. NRRL S-87 TaxID=1463920 RepID=UPI00068B1CBD|nr:hypothetical protein [Streptomyces sp. NRRL S-87]